MSVTDSNRFTPLPHYDSDDEDDSGGYVHTAPSIPTSPAYQDLDAISLFSRDRSETKEEYQDPFPSDKG